MTRLLPYRIVTDYEGLRDGFLDRIEDLNVTLEQIDMAGGFASGNAQKLLSKNPGNRIQRNRDHRHASATRSFGWVEAQLCKALAMKSQLVVDAEREAVMQAEWERQRRKTESCRT
jgi:hypothetical protein